MVYVVDDDKAMRDSVCMLLESVGIAFRTFSCANDFLAFCNPMKEGCMLLDVRMPGMSGMELLEMLKPKGIMLPVILITGHGDVPMAVRALKLGPRPAVLARSDSASVVAAREKADPSSSARRLGGLAPFVPQGRRDDNVRRVATRPGATRTVESPCKPLG